MGNAAFQISPQKDQWDFDLLKEGEEKRAVEKIKDAL